MKVLLVSSSSGSRGGGEFYFHGLATGLRSLGHQVQLILSNGQHMDEFAETMSSCAEIVRIPMINTYHRRARLLSAVADSRRRNIAANYFRKLEPDIVHINKQNLEDGLELILAARDCAIPAVATIHVTRSAVALGAVAGTLRDVIARGTLRRARIPLIGTSAQCTEDLIRFVDDPSLPCFNVPNGAFEVEGNRDAARKSWGASEDQLVLGIVARIEAQKNPLFVSSLIKKLPGNAKLVWVGDGSMRGQLEQQLSRDGVLDRVYLAGWQQHARQLMAGFDVFLLPSLYEGFPFAILEAMSAGLPCVVSDVDGTRDAIQDNETGFLCEVNDVGVWVETLRNLIEQENLRCRIGRAARERFLKEFSLTAMSRRTVDVYHKVVERAKSQEARG